MLEKKLSSYLFGNKSELEIKKYIFLNQIISIGILILAGIAVYVTEKVNPDFFNYPYLTWNIKSENVLRFWPLFTYAAVMAYISSRGLVSTRNDAGILSWGIITSILAGIWEELGYRCLFVCVAMISIAAMNWTIATLLGPLFAMIMIVIGTALFFLGHKDNIKFFSGLLILLIGIGMFLVSSQNNPVFWIYDHITVPIANFVTFGWLGNIFYGNQYPRLFVFGLVSANASFRDGHKYQGVVGVINAWIIGFILMYAMLSYGLLIAMIIHVIYDLEFDFIRYVFRKTDLL